MHGVKDGVERPAASRERTGPWAHHRRAARRKRLARFWGISFGVLTHALFAITVWGLFWFLKGHPAQRNDGLLTVDLLLVLQFAVVHSALLLPRVRRRLEQWIPSPFYGCFYCMATCGGLLITFGFWRQSSVVLWQWEGAARAGIQAAFFASWAALFYSLHLTGLGYQTGLTPWLHWLRGRSAPRRTFHPKGAYHCLRHPVYLSFLGLLWFTPVVTADRAVLTGVWSLYIFIGSYLKDERLAFYLGRTYRAYQRRVPGYPFMVIGPLARRATRAARGGERCRA